MTLNRFRRALYTLAKYTGDMQALTHPKPGKAIPKRVGRRLAGKLTGRAIGSIFKPTK